MKTLRQSLPLLIGIAVAIIVLVVVGVAGSGHSTVTKPRLERSIVESFTNRYLAQAKLLGKKGITARSLDAKADCNRGLGVPDRGPGPDWICNMSWNDPAVSLPDGSAKFEVTAHNNDCYTAGGPSKTTGLQTITDVRGNSVPNPVYAWDACFDPDSNNAPTNVDLIAAASAPPTAAPPASSGSAPVPSQLDVTTKPLTPSSDHTVNVPIDCTGGKSACIATLAPTIDGHALPQVSLAIANTTTGTVPIELTGSQARRGGSLTIQLHMTTGTASQQTTTIPVRAR